MVLPATLLPRGPYYCTTVFLVLCHSPEPQIPSVCAARAVAGTHMKGFGYCSDKSPRRLSGSDDFHAAIWTVVIRKVNSLLVLIGVAGIVCLVRLKIKQGNATCHHQAQVLHMAKGLLVSLSGMTDQAA